MLKRRCAGLLPGDELFGGLAAGHRCVSTQTGQSSTGPESPAIHSQDLRDTLVRVAVMDVWVMWMAVRQHLMPVRVLMRLGAVPH